MIYEGKKVVVGDRLTLEVEVVRVDGNIPVVKMHENVSVPVDPACVTGHRPTPLRVGDLVRYGDVTRRVIGLWNGKVWVTVHGDSTGATRTSTWILAEDELTRVYPGDGA